MTDIPVLFSRTMIRALLDGRKTMTRRLAWRCKLGPLSTGILSNAVKVPSRWQKVRTGDRLWVREAIKAAPLPNFLTGEPTNAICGFYAADDEPVVEAKGFNVAAPWWHYAGALRAFHMPRWASRLTLIVEGTRIERLQDISEADALAEGVTEENTIVETICYGGPPVEITEDRYFLPGLEFFEPENGWESAWDAFHALWNHLHGPTAWDENPELIALKFSVVRENIDKIGERENAAA